MSGALLTELVASLCNVGRRVVRFPQYPVTEWLGDHPGESQEGYKDWLLLSASLKDQLRGEGKVVQEVPFKMDEYRSWLESVVGDDTRDNRLRYMMSLSSRELRRLSRLAPLRHETPFGEVKVGDVVYLPIILEDDSALANLAQLKGRMNESVTSAIRQVLVDAVDLDVGVEELSELRCRGLEVDIFPKLVSALDFDGGFSEKHSKWLTDKMEQGLSRVRPRPQALKPELLPFVGISISMWGEAAQLGNLYGLSLDVVECAKIEDLVCKALGLTECECSDALLASGKAVSGTLEYLGEVDGDDDDDDDDDDEVDPLELDSPQPGINSLSLFGIDTGWDESGKHRSDLSSSTGKKSRMGVVLPFTKERR